MNMQRWWKDTAWGKPKYSEKNLYQRHFATNLIRNGLGLILGFFYEWPTTYCLNHGTVIKRGMHAGFWWRKLKEIDHLENLDVE
jgi:hypothetical protein